MKVIFLDFDGVLNNQGWHERQLQSLSDGRIRTIDPAPIGLLNQLVDRTGAAVVVSSDWRMLGSDYVAFVLRSRGFVGEILGATPTIPNKAEAIRQYLRDTPLVTTYVVFDDLEIGIDGPAMIRANPTHGITQDDVDRAVEILK